MTPHERTDMIQTLLAKSRFDTTDLLHIMELLRSEGGCPWDREQTHQSIRSNLIEETYEAIEAIDTSNNILMQEELGDILLQVVFHSRIAEEEGAFCYEDVTTGVCAKLIERHPHIFGDVKADTSSEVLSNWDKIKRKEKGQKTTLEALDGVSRSLPSLMRAAKLSRKAAKAGMSLPEGCAARPEDTAETIGAALFALAARAEAAGVDPEGALYAACESFIASKKDASAKEKGVNS